MSDMKAEDPIVAPLHPALEGMTQDEVDRHWLENVYKPNERQLTARALIMGGVLGGIMSIANLYIGLKIGWSMGMAITSTILAFAMFKGLQSIGVIKDEFTKLENNTVASIASTAGYFCSAGMVSAIPALYLTQQRSLNWIELALWMSAVSFVGIIMAIPMRRQMIDIDRLRFPSGVACAETIKSMHDTASEAIAKAWSLGIGAIVAAILEIPNSIGAIANKAGKVIFKNPLTWAEQLPIPGGFTIAGKKLMEYTIALPSSSLLYGAGAIMGIRVGISMAIGSLILYVWLVPWLALHGIVVVHGEATYASTLGWAVWPGVMCALAASLLQFGLKWRTIASAFGSIGKLAKAGTEKSLMSAVEVPTSWFTWGMALATVFVSLCAKWIFGIPIWMSVLAVALSFVLSIVACRATGETDVTPIGALGKITQFMYAGIRPGHYATNLMTASITAGSASHSADLLTDLKTSYLLGGAPKKQFLAQLLGVFFGAIFCVPAYRMIVGNGETLATPKFPSPAAVTWATVADLLAHGISTSDRGPGAGTPAEVGSVSLSSRPAGSTVGDTLHIIDGPAAGSYQIVMIDRMTVVTDKDLPESVTGAHAEILDATQAVRAKATVEVAGVGKRPAVHFTQMPAGTKVADFVRIDTSAGEVFYRVKGLRGDTAVLDHPFADGSKPDSPPVPLTVKKLSLPPYAILATLIAILFGILITLLEVYGPKPWRPYLPSVTGLGIAWVITCHDSLAMAIGAIAAWILMKVAPKVEERYNVSTSSGIIAGASIMGLIIIVFSQVMHYIVPPG